MLIAKKLLPFLSVLLLAGCSTTITNLTPKQQFRNADGLYPVEVAFRSTQQSLRWETVKPNVVIGKEFYPMRFTSLMTNRWETLLPVPAGTSVVYYQFKFDYNYNAFGTPPKSDSRMSTKYRLQILDK